MTTTHTTDSYGVTTCMSYLSDLSAGRHLKVYTPSAVATREWLTTMAWDNLQNRLETQARFRKELP